MDDEIKKLLHEFLDRFSTSPGLLNAASGTLSGGSSNFDGKKILDKFDKSIKKSSYELDSINKALDQFDQAISDAEKGLIDGQRKAELEKQKEELLKQKSRQLQQEENEERVQAAEGVTKKIGATFAPLTQTVGKLTASFQSSADGSEMARSVVGAGLDLAGSAAGGVAKGLTGVGTALSSSFNPAVAAAGIGLSVFGSILGSASEAITKFLKFGNEVLSKEVDKTVKAFNQASSAGAVFSDGMSGIRNSATDTGLTIEQFSNIIKKQSAQLSESGLGVAEGAKKVGEVGKIIKNSGVQDKLLKLGYGFEEQAELTAETIANMRRATGGDINNQTVAQETEKYANNLRLLSAITGEDAKSKAEKVKSENNELAFQLKLSKMSSEQRAQINAAMLSMTEQERKNLKDRMIYNGQVVNKAGAIYEATIDGAAELGRKQKQLLDEGNLTAETNLRESQASAARIKQGLENLDGGAALAGFHSGGDLREAMQGGAEKLGQTIKLIDLEFDKTLQDIKNVQKTPEKGGDELTGSLITAEKAAQGLKVGVQELLLPAMDHYAKFTSKMLSSLEEQLEKILGRPSQATERHNQRIRTDITMPSPELGMYGIASNSEPGMYSNGGIAKGATSGFLAMLHGEELVLPLDNGKIKSGTEGFKNLAQMLGNTNTQRSSENATQNPIFDNIDSSTKSDQMLVSEIRNLVKLVTEQNKLAEEANNARKTLIDITESHKRTADRILDAAT